MGQCCRRGSEQRLACTRANALRQSVDDPSQRQEKHRIQQAERTCTEQVGKNRIEQLIKRMLQWPERLAEIQTLMGVGQEHAIVHPLHGTTGGQKTCRDGGT